MNETDVLDPWVANETWVTYRGVERMNTLGGGQKFKVVKANDRSAAVDAGIFGEQWAAKTAWRVTTPPADIEDVFTAAVGGERAKLVAEIERLDARLAELRTALRVIDSL